MYDESTGFHDRCNVAYFCFVFSDTRDVNSLVPHVCDRSMTCSSLHPLADVSHASAGLIKSIRNFGTMSSLVSDKIPTLSELHFLSKAQCGEKSFAERSNVGDLA